MTQLLILADDFTGALDTGVQFATVGAVTRVITGQSVSLSEFAGTCEVLVVDAETRHLTAAKAADIVGGYTAQAVNLGIPHIYKKRTPHSGAMWVRNWRRFWKTRVNAVFPSCRPSPRWGVIQLREFTTFRVYR